MNKLVRNGLLVASLVALAVLVHYHLRSSSPLYNFFFSPSDLYKTLGESSFDLSKQGLEKELKFTTKYPGNHWLAILVESPPEIMEKYKSDFEVKVQVLSESGVISESVVSDSSFWFYGGQQRSGFALATYKAPSDLPLGQPLTIKATVINESPGFTEKYGKQRLIMSKYSDE
jgi:hypothetical protein